MDRAADVLGASNPGALVERQKEWTEQKLLYYFVFQLTSPVLGAIAAQSSAAGELTREVLINLLTADPDEPHHLPVMVGPVSRIDKARKVVRTVARGQKVVKSARRSKAATRIVQGAARLTKEQKKVVDTVEEAYQFVIEGFMKRAKRLPKGEKVEPHEIGTWADKIVKDWLRKDLAKRKVFRGLEIHSDVRVGIGRIDIDLYFPKLKLAIELKKSVKAVKARQATAQSTIPDNINFPPGTVVVTLFGH